MIARSLSALSDCLDFVGPSIVEEALEVLAVDRAASSRLSLVAGAAGVQPISW